MNTRTKDPSFTAPAWQALDMRHSAIVEKIFQQILEDAEKAHDELRVVSVNKFLVDVLILGISDIRLMFPHSTTQTDPEVVSFVRAFNQLHDFARNEHETKYLLGELCEKLFPYVRTLSDSGYERWSWDCKEEVYGVNDIQKEVEVKIDDI